LYNALHTVLYSFCSVFLYIVSVIIIIIIISIPRRTSDASWQNPRPTRTLEGNGRHPEGVLLVGSLELLAVGRSIGWHHSPPRGTLDHRNIVLDRRSTVAAVVEEEAGGGHCDHFGSLARPRGSSHPEDLEAVAVAGRRRGPPRRPVVSTGPPRTSLGRGSLGGRRGRRCSRRRRNGLFHCLGSRGLRASTSAAYRICVGEEAGRVKAAEAAARSPRHWVIFAASTICRLEAAGCRRCAWLLWFWHWVRRWDPVDGRRRRCRY
jgi:hypothetical protein